MSAVLANSLTPAPAEFYQRDVQDLARALLGTYLISYVAGELVGGRIVEVEAYGGRDDLACHADSDRPTPRNQTMFGDPGRAYVYLSYGIHHCFNVVAPRGQKAAAVLIRALEPIWGLELMRRRRGLTQTKPASHIGSGPGKLCQALGITTALDGHDLTNEPLRIYFGTLNGEEEVVAGPRIGLNSKIVREAFDYKWRYGIGRNPNLSRPFPRDS